jgi:hypothetical protein
MRNSAILSDAIQQRRLEDFLAARGDAHENLREDPA